MAPRLDNLEVGGDGESMKKLYRAPKNIINQAFTSEVSLLIIMDLG